MAHQHWYSRSSKKLCNQHKLSFQAIASRAKLGGKKRSSRKIWNNFPGGKNKKNDRVDLAQFHMKIKGPLMGIHEKAHS